MLTNSKLSDILKSSGLKGRRLAKITSAIIGSDMTTLQRTKMLTEYKSFPYGWRAIAKAFANHFNEWMFPWGDIKIHSGALMKFLSACSPFIIPRIKLGHRMQCMINLINRIHPKSVKFDTVAYKTAKWYANTGFGGLADECHFGKDTITYSYVCLEITPLKYPFIVLLLCLKRNAIHLPLEIRMITFKYYLDACLSKD